MGICYYGLSRITFPFLEIAPWDDFWKQHLSHSPSAQLRSGVSLSPREMPWLRSVQLEHVFAPMIHAGVGIETSQGLALLEN